MTEDKDTEAIAKLMTTDCARCDGKKIKNCGDAEENGYCGMDLEIASKILQTLTSLGYVKLAEQKLPFLNPDDPCYKGKLGYTSKMLKVDSEGCAYRRVYVGGKIK